MPKKYQKKLKQNGKKSKLLHQSSVRQKFEYIVSCLNDSMKILIFVNGMFVIFLFSHIINLLPILRKSNTLSLSYLMTAFFHKELLHILEFPTIPFLFLPLFQFRNHHWYLMQFQDKIH